MRLKSVFISNYKNLSNFSLEFDCENFVEFFVGKNGSGKSNFLEALLEIFNHILSFDHDRSEINFSYSIVYEISDETVEISWIEDQLTINGNARQTIGKTSVPENVLVYYSGHNDSVRELVEQSEARFQRRIRTAEIGESRKIIGIDYKYKELLLALSLVLPDGNTAQKYILEKLGVKGVGLEKPGDTSLTEPVIKLVLDRPDYASGGSSNAFDIENNDVSDRFWKPEGITKDFLSQINECVISSPGGLTVENGYLRDQDKYILYLEVEKFKDIFKATSVKELFHQFDNLKTLGMLTELSVPFVLESNTNLSLSCFSDGQFQSVYIYAITEIFKDVDCITLLDEPDAFLHPEWQFSYLEQVSDICEEASRTNHVLMSSHSASTLTKASDESIHLFDIDGPSLKVRQIPKAKIIKSLSAGLISFSEGEARLNIRHMLDTTSGPVLFTEGVTDEKILEVAWDKLNPNTDRPFQIEGAYDRFFLRNMFSRDELAQNHPERTMVALFDFDEAYDDWNGLKTPEGVDLIESNPMRGLCKQLRCTNHYAVLLPVPDNEEIKRQVLDAEGEPWGRGSDSHLPIELLFFDAEVDGEWFETQQVSGGGQIINFCGNKVKFAEEVIPNMESKKFEVFRPLFEFLVEKSQEANEATAA